MRSEKQNDSDPFSSAEAICARLGIRRNSGKRGRTPGGDPESRPAPAEQQGFEFREWRNTTMRNEKRNVSDPYGTALALNRNSEYE